MNNTTKQSNAAQVIIDALVDADASRTDADVANIRSFITVDQMQTLAAGSQRFEARS